MDEAEWREYLFEGQDLPEIEVIPFKGMQCHYCDNVEIIMEDEYWDRGPDLEFRRRGWAIDGYGADVCPSCHAVYNDSPETMLEDS